MIHSDGAPHVDDEMRALLSVMMRPGYQAWEQRLRAIGGCEHPIYLKGRTVTLNAVSGEVLRVFDSAGQPDGRLMTACGNRRASRCEPCSRLYQADTFHLIRAGLAGGKGVPDSVALRPRVFATLTAPSFGPVHTRVEYVGGVRRCRPRRRPVPCEHGVMLVCRVRHEEDDPALGTPLCGACFDYTGAVLWNAHAGVLWHRFTDDLRRVTLPALCGLTAAQFAREVRVSFAKVAEYQRRGLVHFHAVIRLDGPDGGSEQPPSWATLDLLDAAIRAAAARTWMTTPDGLAGSWPLTWGEQIDIRPVLSFGDGETLTDDAVAAYVAKYATKAAECVGTLDRPVMCRSCAGTGLAGACPSCGGSGLRVPLVELPVPAHARTLIGTAWRLGALPEYRDLRLRAWAHQCGYGGHFSTKSRHYSTTLGALRAARSEYRADERHERGGLPDEITLVRDWEFVGSGYSGPEAEIAAGVREEIAEYREIVQDVRAELRAERAGGDANAV